MCLVQRGAQETAAIVLLLVGGFLGGAGWLIGLVLLWLSQVWTLRDKLIGTLLVPGGLALPVLLAIRLLIGGVTQVALAVALMILLAVGSVAGAVYLARHSLRPA